MLFFFMSILQKDTDLSEVPLPPAPSEPGPKPPLPPTAPGANIQIRRGYDPKAPKAAPAAVPSDKFLISPITGERVPAESMAEHMKISLLDPRWREHRDRVLQEKKEQEQVFAEGKIFGAPRHDYDYDYFIFFCDVNVKQEEKSYEDCSMLSPRRKSSLIDSDTRLFNTARLCWVYCLSSFLVCFSVML